MPNVNTYRKNEFHDYCPYYRKESPTEIRCKGIVGEHTTSTFHDKASKKEYMKDFCLTDCHEGCAIYQAIKENDGYEDGSVRN